MNNDLATESPKVEAILTRVRSLVKRLLEREAKPADVSYVLSYVATELGLVMSEDPARVFPVVLKGLSQAATNYAEAKVAETGVEAPLGRVPVGVTIH